MAKIWCEECCGTGETPGQNPLAVIKRLCKACHGKGYTEQAVVEVEKARNKLIEHSTLDGLMAYTTPLSIWLDSLKEAK